MALNPAWDRQMPDTYSTDFREVLPEGKLYKSSNDAPISETDVSLVTGKVRGYRPDEDNATNIDYDGTLQERSKAELVELNSMAKFNDRTFRGLEQRLGQDEPSSIEQGRKGIPIKYEEGDV